MTLFPFFVNIKGKMGMIIGGGKHALEKVERLLPYEPHLIVIDPAPLTELREKEGIQVFVREFAVADLEQKPAFVVVAGEDAAMNHEIADLCRERQIPVNVVDDKEYCDFIFPALIAKGSLSVGICTNGASPAAGVLLKQRFLQSIPEQMDEILDFLEEKREEIKKRILHKKERFAVYYRLAETCMELGRPLTEKEWELFF